MRETCTMAAETLHAVQEIIRPGITTEDVDNFVHEYITSRNAYPSPLNYHGFPKSCCTSPNEVICHGIPSKKVKLKDGDILNVDVTTYFKKYHGDTNRTYFVGDNVSPLHKRLVRTAWECMMSGIREVAPGKQLGDIGAAIESIAHKQKFSVVRDYCGHGIGREFHEEPQVLHYGKRKTGMTLRKGMIFTIEPMINVGSYKTNLLKDNWTVLTIDKKWSAQFEHTILVTETGYEILTILPGIYDETTPPAPEITLE